MAITAILTDIEGTTTPISFVAEVLFPYARTHLAAFLRDHAEDPAVRESLDAARALAGKPELDIAGVTELLIQWIDEDRKATPLKDLQGLIWADGYVAGAFQGDLYPDVLPALIQWRESSRGLYIYSSGSVASQRLLFGHSIHGDLIPLFSGYFDTRIGPKIETDSYRRIAAEIGTAPESILFLSDSEKELDAARQAGLQTIRLARDGAVESSHPVHDSFATIRLDFPFNPIT